MDHLPREWVDKGREMAPEERQTAGYPQVCASTNGAELRALGAYRAGPTTEQRSNDHAGKPMPVAMAGLALSMAPNRKGTRARLGAPPASEDGKGLALKPESLRFKHTDSDADLLLHREGLSHGLSTTC